MTGSDPARFAHARPADSHPRSQIGPLYRGSPFQPLPPPTRADGTYRLDLAAVVPEAAAAMARQGSMVFHVAGDTGGVRDPVPQSLVAQGLEEDASVTSTAGQPGFLYHLGDVIYFDGQAAEYYPQFYEPYEFYKLPIFAIPGNHDGDRYDNGQPVSATPSLGAFVRNFCAAQPGFQSPDARGIARTAMIQPNVFWTLLTPLATFVGLYTNVPEGGVVEPAQQDWLAGELADADAEKPLLVCLHHPIHSLDAYHSGSQAMARVLNDAVQRAGRRPSLVLSGHVHNYQRFTVTDAAGETPFLVAGNGGYHNLHRMLRPGGADLLVPYPLPDDPTVTLERFVDDRFGFLRAEITPETVTISAFTVPRPQEPWRTPPRRADLLRYDWRRRKLVR